MTSSQVKSDIQAYAAGVNAFLRNGRSLPIEFALLRHKPGPWSPLDTIAFGHMMAWILSTGFASKLTRARLVERLGPEAAAELELFYPAENPLTLPRGIEFNGLQPDGTFAAVEGPFIRRNMEGIGHGSNAWVVSGRRTARPWPWQVKH
jgi:penicillin amidase